MSTEGLPRPVSTEDALAYAGRLDDLCNAEWILKRLTDGANALRTLVSERDALAVRVRELEANARRYEWLRAQHWSDNKLGVVLRPMDNTKLGCFIPSQELLDDAIDHMSAALTTTSGDSHG